MANGFKTGGDDFKKGDERINRAGRPVIPDDIKSARKLNQVELERVFNKYFFADQHEVTSVMNSEYAPMIDRMVCRIISIVVMRGSWKHFEFMLQRLLGKVSDTASNPEAMTVNLKYQIGDKPQYRKESEDEHG